MRQRTAWFFFLMLGLAWAEDSGRVKFIRIPEDAVQPQVVVSQGSVRLIYIEHDAANGDIYYIHSEDGGAKFSRPLRVNSKPGSAVAIGNVRGPRLAVGRNGRVHVAWNGSQQSEPKGPSGVPPMLYTRLNDAGTAFEPQRNLIQSAWGVDGGGAVAADRAGNVYVFWHAPEPGRKGEENRRVWLARSTDDGKSFDREKPVWEKPTGACGCCGLDAFASSKGLLWVLYRSATQMVHRDMYMLVSQNHGESFEADGVHPWNVGYCVMSTEAFYEDPAGVLAAWETEHQIYFSRLDPATGKMSSPIPAPGGTGERKYPAVAGNAQGETFLAWTEGMGWKKGGSLTWQVFDKTGRATHEHGHAEGVPVWSLIAAFARADGGFTVVY